MTHEERIAKSDFLVAQMKELIQTTNEKLKEMDDAHNLKQTFTENQASILRKGTKQGL